MSVIPCTTRFMTVIPDGATFPYELILWAALLETI
jgi:hypothetical protein